MSEELFFSAVASSSRVYKGGGVELFVLLIVWVASQEIPLPQGPLVTPKLCVETISILGAKLWKVVLMSPTRGGLLSLF